MTWASLIPLIAQYGIPLAESLWQKWSSKSDPTQADWDELKAMASQSAKDAAKQAITNAGLSLTDPKAVAILALIK